VSAPEQAPRVEIVLGDRGEARLQISDPWLESWLMRVWPKQARPLLAPKRERKVQAFAGLA
jgi:hypothetical protein